MLGQLNALLHPSVTRSVGQEAGQRIPAVLPLLPPHILTVNLKQVKGVQESSPEPLPLSADTAAIQVGTSRYESPTTVHPTVGLPRGADQRATKNPPRKNNIARALIVPGARNVGRVCALCVTHGAGGSRGNTSAFANDAPRRTEKCLRCGGGCGRVQALQQHRRISRIFRARERWPNM